MALGIPVNSISYPQWKNGFPNTEYRMPLNESNKFVYSPKLPPSTGMETWISKDLKPVMSDFFKSGWTLLGLGSITSSLASLR